jgi:hypothetical protein
VDAEALRLLYKGMDLPVIVAVIAITQQVKGLVPDRWRPLLPLGLGMLAAFAMQGASPFILSPWNVWRRMLTYGAGASLGYSVLKAQFRNGS